MDRSLQVQAAQGQGLHGKQGMQQQNVHHANGNDHAMS
jgi:hypothetical protein